MGSTSTFQIFPLENLKDFPFFSEKIEPGAKWVALEGRQPALNAELDNVPKSILTYLGRSAHQDFHKYQGIHEVKRERRGRFYDQAFSSYIEIQEFGIYLPKDCHALYLCAARKTAHAFMRRLAQVYSFPYSVVRFNLEKIQHHFSVRGGWFTNLKIPSVTSAALYGANVVGSQDWSRYQQSGNVSFVVIETTVQASIFGGLNPVPVSVVASVTRKGAITLYGNYTEMEKLAIIQSLWKKLGPFMETVNPQRRGRR